MPSFLSFLKSESEGQSSDPVVDAAPSSEEPLPKSLDEDGEADAVTKAIGMLHCIVWRKILVDRRVRPWPAALAIFRSVDAL
jgi:hypothetical protein